MDTAMLVQIDVRDRNFAHGALSKPKIKEGLGPRLHPTHAASVVRPGRTLNFSILCTRLITMSASQQVQGLI